MMTTNQRAAAILMAVFAASGPAHAGRAAAPARAPAVQAVIDCQSVVDGVQRLACFDKTVAGMSQAEAKGDLVTIDREQRRAVRRQAFGLTLPTLAMFDRGEKGDEADRITAKIASAARTAGGKWVVTLDDGAVWRQIDDSDIYRTPHAGSTAVIRKAALGSFFMNVDGQQAIRVHRDN